MAPWAPRDKNTKESSVKLSLSFDCGLTVRHHLIGRCANHHRGEDDAEPAIPGRPAMGRPRHLRGSGGSHYGRRLAAKRVTEGRVHASGCLWDACPRFHVSFVTQAQPSRHRAGAGTQAVAHAAGARSCRAVACRPQQCRPPCADERMETNIGDALAADAC